MKKTYTSHQYTTKELILNPDFISWVKYPTLENGALWISWASLNAKNEEIVAKARKIIVEISADENETLDEELFELWKRIDFSNAVFDQKKSNSTIINFCFYSIGGAAAIITAFLVVSTIVILSFRQQNLGYITGNGQTKTIVLPDSSVLVLNANSSITYGKDWNENKPREIWLNGEGFFSVSHKINSQKFIVHTHDLDVQVLGTKFNVNTRRGKTRVILSSGKVNLHFALGNKNTIIMKPGDLIDFSVSTEKLSKRKVTPQKFNSWINRKLVFEETSLEEIGKVLEENYGYVVKFADPEIASLTFTGTVNNDNVDLLLAVLQKTFNIIITKENSQLSIDHNN